MNEVLRRHFGELTVTPARQKSRVLIATQPTVADAAASSWPRTVEHADLGLTVCAHGAAFAGTTIDIGTRYLLEFLDRMKPDASTAIDLGCGTGVLAASLAQRRPGLRLLATDQSAAAVASAAATMAANGVADRVQVLRDDALSAQPDASAELILLNPPFHIGSSVHAGIALKLFEDAGQSPAPRWRAVDGVEHPPRLPPRAHPHRGADPPGGPEHQVHRDGVHRKLRPVGAEAPGGWPPFGGLQPGFAIDTPGMREGVARPQNSP